MHLAEGNVIKAVASSVCQSTRGQISITGLRGLPKARRRDRISAWSLAIVTVASYNQTSPALIISLNCPVAD
ncbi:unnamed protein product [Leptosia nina]|uniref:Uncharacterized protein n=1 Tax=Leptosia nina TaxID=320188 RepID=A0AAV1JT70_9NEOP